MIKEKYKWPISILGIALSIIFMISLMKFNISNQNNGDVQTDNTKQLAAVLDKNSITDINISIADSDWEWLMENATNEEYRNADITINGETYYNVGIRPKGNSTLTTVASDDTTDRFSFKVKFDEYVSGQNYHGMDSIVLNNIIQDITYMKEYISYDLCDFMGIATPEMSYANITLNNEAWGLYLAIEVVDKRYLENNFGTTDGNLYKPETMAMGGNKGGQEGGMPKPPEGFNPEEMKNKNGNPDEMNQGAPEGMNQGGPQGGPGGGMGGPGGGRATNGADFKYIDDDVSSYSTVRDSAVFKRTTDADFKKVINMFKNLNDGTNLEEVLDVEEVLKYFAVNTYLTNFDSYSGAMYHNYYLYEKDGKCQILPWDFNLSFGGFSQGAPGQRKNNDNNESGANSMINFPIDKVVTGDLADAPLIGKLLEVDEYKELYHSYLKQIAEEYFKSGYYANLVNKLDNLINEYVKNDATAFYGYDKYTASIPNFLLWGEDRTKSVVAQLKGEQPSTEYGDIQSDVDMSSLTDMGMGKGGPGGGRPGEGNAQAEGQQPGAPDQGNAQAGGQQPGAPDQGNAQAGGQQPGAPDQGNAQAGGQQAGAPDQGNAQAEGQQPGALDKNAGMPDKDDNAQQPSQEGDTKAQDNVSDEDASQQKEQNGENNGDSQMMHHPGQMVQTNNTKNFAIIAGYVLVGIAGVLFASKFKRRGRRK